MRIRIVSPLAGCGIALALVLSVLPAAAQGDQWNALYDRIIRLEHEVKSLNGGGQMAGQQPSGDAAFRLNQLEDQMRQLMSQMQDLSYQMREMQRQMGAGKQGSYQPPAEEAPQQQAYQPEAPPEPQRQAEAPQQPDYSLEQSNEPLDYSQYQSTQPYQPQDFAAENNSGTYDQGQQQLAPGPKNLGQLRVGQQGQMQQAVPGNMDDGQQGLLPEKVESASLDGSQATSQGDPQSGYQQAYDNLLGRRFGEAEAGFKTFLGQNADSPLAGDAQYWLGETYYAQGDYKQAAQSFLKGYKSYPKNRKAPDSLLKLGMSLQKLGQKEQACGSYGQVTKEYPKASSVRNQALKEMQRAGC